jgi:hypothetical protein
MRRRPLLSTLAVLTLFACGGGATPANTAQADTADASAAASSGDHATSADAGAHHDDEMKPFAGVDLGEPPPSSSAKPAAPAAPEAKDECTPVGVDFEKRARPKLKECYREGKKKEPDLKGTVKITVVIDTLGKIKNTKIAEKTLPDPVARCMLEVVKKTPFPEVSKCPGKEITIPMTFPTP